VRGSDFDLFTKNNLSHLHKHKEKARPSIFCLVRRSRILKCKHKWAILNFRPSLLEAGKETGAPPAKNDKTDNTLK